MNFISKKRKRAGFLEKSLDGIAHALERASFSEHTYDKGGFLQRLDPRVKVIGFLLIILSSAASKSLLVILSIYIFSIILAIASKVSLGAIARTVWIGALIFTGAIALPALFLTPGNPIFHIPILGWGVTEQGVKSAAFLISRVITSATFAFLLVLTTPWSHILKSLHFLRVPVLFVVILNMTYRYIFLLLRTAQNMFESRRSRTVGKLSPADSRRITAATAGVLLSKSMKISSDVYMAMQSRGFRGEVRTLEDFTMSSRDWLVLVTFVSLSCLWLWLGI